MSKFKDSTSLEDRLAESARIRAKYPDRVPCIVEKAEKSDIPTIDKKKFLVPSDLTIGQFVYVIRKRIKLSSEKAIFIFVNNVLPPSSSLLSQVYTEHASDDGFLYVLYSSENTFGRREMKILNSPQDFKRQLLNAIKNSKQTWLNCLYIGDQEFKEIIQENRGKLDIGMDYYRGNRQKLPMVQNVRMHYWKSPNYTLISQVLPKRWNETLGTFHCKGFVMDDQVILSGANLSADYFDNRQDRYILFKCKDLAQIYRKLFSQIHSTSYTMGENGEFISPEKGYEQLLEIAKELENNQEELQVLKKMETETTFIVPTLQMGALGIRQEELMLEWIFDLVGKQGGRGYLSSAYLNIPQRLCKIIQESRIKLDLLTSSPEANGFYGAQNVSKYLPDAYSYLELELLNSLKEKIQIYEYKRPGWTFHAKGFWANFTFRGNKWTVCTIGSSNFNSRSLNTDLESQAFLFTKDPSLSLELDNNRLDLFKYSSPVSVADLEKRQIKPLVKVAARLVRTWL